MTSIICDSSPWLAVLSFAATSWAHPAFAQSSQPSVSKSSTQSAKAPKDTQFGLEVGGGLGFATALGLGGAPEVSLSAGPTLGTKYGQFAVLLEGGYQYYSAQASGALPCTPGQQGACIEGNSGQFTSKVQAHVGRVSTSLVYRLDQLHRRWVPEIGVSPGLYLSRVNATSFRLLNSQFGTNFGVSSHLGVAYNLPKGSMHFRGGYQWSSVKQRITGESSLHTFLFSLGYRIAI